MKQNNTCPKCGEKLSPFYMKQTCPKCGVNLMYYKLDERLEKDAENAAAEVERVEKFTGLLKDSSVKTPLHIIRLVLFFTPLASMCLPMFYAGHKNVSLIGFILSIVNHGFDIGAMAADKAYLFAVLSMVFIILLSLAVIISSLFSAGKRGFRRNIIFSSVNTLVFAALSILVCTNSGEAKIGFYLTAAIYIAELVLHYVLAKPKNKKRLICTAIPCALMLAVCVMTLVLPKDKAEIKAYPKTDGSIRVISYNTAAPWGTPFDGTNSADRVKRFVRYIYAQEPDLIGTQELNSAWLTYLNGKLMLDYDGYAVLRGGDDSENTSEMNGVFWKKDKFKALETNTFWLSETPDKESRYTYVDENGEQQEAGCNRICSYAVLQSENGELVGFFNTHLDNSSEEAMNFGAELIISRIDEIKAKYGDIKIILSGDFNQTDEGVAYKTISASLSDTTDKSKETATWQDWGYTSTGDKPIDFIFTSGTPEEYFVLDDLSRGYISDHYGIMADIN